VGEATQRTSTARDSFRPMLLRGLLRLSLLWLGLVLICIS
jgi:hypothetical protein